MSAIGTLIFCNRCGNLLNVQGSSETIDCRLCLNKIQKSKFNNLKIVTKSSENAFPSRLKLKKSLVKTTLSSEEVEKGAIIKEKCPQCGHNEMKYYTLQLRSADEGATVFYSCTECDYRFKVNN